VPRGLARQPVFPAPRNTACKPSGHHATYAEWIRASFRDAGSCRRRRMRPRVLAGRHGRPSRAGRRGGHGGKRRWAARVAFSHCRQWSSCTAKTVSRQPLTRCERGMEPAAGRKVCVGSWEAPRAPHPHHGHRQWPQISLRTAYRTPRSGRTPPLVFSVSGPGPRLASVRRTHPRHVASDALAQSTA
jgi:hypothetical protein